MAEDCLNQCLGGCGASNYLQNIFKDNLLQELLKVSIGIEVFNIFGNRIFHGI